MNHRYRLEFRAFHVQYHLISNSLNPEVNIEKQMNNAEVMQDQVRKIGDITSSTIFAAEKKIKILSDFRIWYI